MEIKIITSPIKKSEISKIASEQFGDFVKAVVDIKQDLMAIGGELHADEETILVEKNNSNRTDVWGINLYPDKSGDDWIEFDSMINLKPQYGNRSRGVEDDDIQKKIKDIVNKLII